MLSVSKEDIVFYAKALNRIITKFVDLQGIAQNFKYVLCQLFSAFFIHI